MLAPGNGSLHHPGEFPDTSAGMGISCMCNGEGRRAMYNVCKIGWRGYYSATASVTCCPLTVHLSLRFSHTNGHDLCFIGGDGGCGGQQSEGWRCSEALRLCTGWGETKWREEWNTTCRCTWDNFFSHLFKFTFMKMHSLQGQTQFAVIHK